MRPDGTNEQPYMRPATIKLTLKTATPVLPHARSTLHTPRRG